MQRVPSLTEAVKHAAAGGGSLTEEVRKAAREGADGDTGDPVGPSHGVLAGRHDGSQGGRHPWGPAPATAGYAARWRRSEREAPAPERKPWFARPAAAQRPEPEAVDLEPIAFPRMNPLALAASRLRAVSARLAGIAAISLLSLLVTPSVVGTADRPGAGAATSPQQAQQLLSHQQPQQRRVALVIGNSAYRHARKLTNPRNDAADIGAAFRKHGFDVIEGFDLDRAALDAKIREFAALLRGADVGVFFYAGHGLNVAGHNYLVPVDARLTVASALDLELVRLDRIHQTMEREAATNVLFFDACRDDPLSDSLVRALGTRSASADFARGLAAVRSGAGTLISFSTQPGTLALDGKGRNSPYSGALARQLSASHDDLAAMLIAVRNEVMRETDGRQVPWEHSALTGRFYFNVAAEAQGPALAPHHLKAREAFDAWSATRDTTSVGVLNAFIARYGDTFYAALARARIEELRRSDKMPLPSSLGVPSR